MIRAALLAAALPALSGCLTTMTYEVAAGVNVAGDMPWTRDSDFDCNDALRLTARRESDDGRRFVAFTHISSISCGWPVNDKPEQWLDLVEAGLKFGKGAR